MTIYYLYKKTHRITGLQYLGQTVRDPFVYKGSGTRWKRHLNKHGEDIHTEVLGIFDTKEALAEAGMFFSVTWNIVEDKSWANLKYESGDGGFRGIVFSEESISRRRTKVVAKNRAQAQDPEWRARQAVKNKALAQDPKWKKNHTEAMRKMVIKRSQNLEWRANVAQNNKAMAQDPKWQKSHAEAISKRSQNQTWRENVARAGAARRGDLKAKMRSHDNYHNREPRSCPHCNYTTKSYGNLNRWHGDNCHMTEAGRAKRDALRGVPRPGISASRAAREPRSCPHCNYTTKNYPNLTRFHGDNCKKRVVTPS